jgi:dolichyl-phosphate-mannose--protein O-mannosyl transferase
VWIIAISPLIAAGAIGYVLDTSATLDLTSWMLQVAVAAPYILVLLFAIADRSSLAALGHEKPAAWTWAALTAPVYLIARANVIRREMGGGGVPLIIWAVSVVLAIVGFVAFGLIAQHPLLAGLPG